ncbi:hypothetical protein [Nocardia sp. NPDC049707]|uniref:oxidoreductase n=1 Tax=Nocardia sp. NPDC049707 TaxID=3154735 RepID=UPI00344A1B01
MHAAGGRIFAQLWHVGRMTHPLTLPGGATPLAPSPERITRAKIFTSQGMVDHVTPRAMTTAEVDATIEDFAAEARNAIAAGFDGVEVHGANGYLVQQFLAENTNQRTDRYGGSRNGRLRLVVDILPRSRPKSVRSEWACASHRTTPKTRSRSRTHEAPTEPSWTP